MRARHALCAALLAAVSAGAEVELRVNPFERPELTPEAAAPGESALATNAPWRPVLRGTLVAGSGSLANLGGTVLGLGEEVHGYRLREVRTFEAVFDKGDATLVLPVESDAEDAR